MWIPVEEHSSRGKKQQMQTEAQGWPCASGFHGTAGKPVASVAAARGHREQTVNKFHWRYSRGGKGQDENTQAQCSPSITNIFYPSFTILKLTSRMIQPT